MGSANSSSTATISTNINSIPLLNGTNFNGWKRHLLIALDSMNIDLALREEQLQPLTMENTPYVKRDFERMLSLEGEMRLETLLLRRN
ncbi:hypothetical protein J1N35_033501 [Gossypium stocksii]|uniref:Uncharacterized protein n=1 Tax=Gossypium stocksii TaxID=47602 RepID=A0A9D3UQI2_9ROSI|nr:hypothetical protein J1N35_033501 [Gossypium stocksii]